jgi:2,4-dienoyl-CoA reductase-like NADH-dependent reductase (Old Yellow Enzyme family)
MNYLQSPFTFKNGVVSKNPIALSPLTNTQSHLDGTLGPDERHWLLRQARGGFGIITTCAAYIEPYAKAWNGQLGINSEHMQPALKELTTSLKKEGSINIMQLFHAGVRAPSAITGRQPMSASEFELPIAGFEKPRAMTLDDIHMQIQYFANATKRALEAGFDGVEIHGANGYLLTQFFSTQTNLRDDDYGGSWVNRARFCRQIVKACRDIVPRSFIIGIRLLAEGEGLDLDENIQLSEWLVDDGIDYISLSLRDSLATPQKYTHQSQKPMVRYFKDRLNDNVALIVGGGIQTLAQAEATLKHGASIITLGRTAIGNPEWPKRLYQPNFTPVAPPYHATYLQKTGISETFIRYLENMPSGFVLQPPT